MRVADPAQASAFTNELRSRVLIACSEGEKSLSQLHQQFGVPLPKLHYHVSRLVQERLLGVARSEPRAGRAIRYYRAVADRFWVPQALLPDLPGDALADELRQALRRETNRIGDVWVVFAPDPVRQMSVQLVRSKEAGPAKSCELWRRLQLDPRQRSALEKDLLDLVERYTRAASGSGAERYILHAAFAPSG